MNIHYFMYMNSTGYSIAAQDYILALRESSPEINLKLDYLNVVTKTGVSENRRQLFTAMHRSKIDDFDISLYHSIPHRYRRPRGPKKHVGLCLFETMNPPKDWVSMMNEMDAIITASEFNHKIFETNGVEVPIYVVPHAFNPKLFHKDVVPKGRYQPFTFLSIGTWKQRKNWEGLVKAFYDAFDRKDHVCLLIKTDKPQELESMVERVKRTCEWRSKDTAPIYSERTTNCDFENIPQFMKKGDVYVNASLGEGFGLPGLHAMALGIPLITTKFGGVLQYAKEDFCTHIVPKHYKTYPTMDRIPQFNNCIWPVIRINEIRDRMREVYENTPRDKAEKAYDFVHRTFSYDVVGKQFSEALQACCNLD